MAWWTGEFLKLAQEATSQFMDKFIVDSGLYIDGNNFFYFIPPLIMRWNGEQRMMIIEQDKINEDRAENEKVRTMKEVIKMECQIRFSFLQSPSSSNFRLCLLNTQVYCTY